MLFFKKRKNILIKIFLSFTAILVSFSLCANSEKSDAVYLKQNSIDEISCTETNCFFPSKSLSNKNIYIEGQVRWSKAKNLILQTTEDIFFEENGKLIGTGKGTISLKAGMEPGEKNEYNKTVVFKGKSVQIEMEGEGKIKIYYNPQGKMRHRYLNPSYNYYRDHIKAKNIKLYMLVNDVEDLQSIGAVLHRSYALSQPIKAAKTQNWNNGKGFEPLQDEERNMPFSGDFDGNDYFIEGLYINRPDENYVGLFGKNKGRERSHNVIENLTLKDFAIIGNHYVGSLAGSAINSDLINIKVITPKIESLDVAGGLAGTTVNTQIDLVQIIGPVNIVADENKGLIIGGGEETKVSALYDKEKKNNFHEKTLLFGNKGENIEQCIFFETEPTMNLFLGKNKFSKNQDGKTKICNFYATKQNTTISYDLF